MKIKSCKDEYLAKATLLTEVDAEYVMSRIGNKLLKRLEKEGLSKHEILGIQLEIEDDQLLEWREKVAAMREEESKKQKSSKKEKNK